MVNYETHRQNIISSKNIFFNEIRKALTHLSLENLLQVQSTHGNRVVKELAMTDFGFTYEEYKVFTGDLFIAGKTLYQKNQRIERRFDDQNEVINLCLKKAILDYGELYKQ